MKQLFMHWNGLLIPAGIGIILAVILGFAGDRWWSSVAERVARADTTAFSQEPTYIGTVEFPDSEGRREPFALAYVSGELIVSSRHSGVVDVFDRNFHRRGTRAFSHAGVSSSITGLAGDDDRLYVADEAMGEIRFHRHDGALLEAFDWLPGKAGRLSPEGLSLYKGNLYVADPGNRRLLAISASTAQGLTEDGELLLAMPNAANGDTAILHTPAATVITKDGRILVSDRTLHCISVFTCNGRLAEQWKAPGEIALGNPAGIAIDNLPSPALLNLDATSFDPSGVRHQGRIHVVDSDRGEVVVFDALGGYVLRYGKGILQSPNGIAINEEQRTIVIANTGGHNLVVYKY